MKYGANNDDFDGNAVPRPPVGMRVHFLDRLAPTTRTIYLGMLMESMRGSWVAPGRRQGIIEELLGIPPECDTRYELALRERFVDSLERSARTFGEQVRSDDYADGRHYRGETGYDGIWSAMGDSVTRSKLRMLSYHIPDDETWNLGAVERAMSQGVFDR